MSVLHAVQVSPPRMPIRWAFLLLALWLYFWPKLAALNMMIIFDIMISSTRAWADVGDEDYYVWVLPLLHLRRAAMVIL